MPEISIHDFDEIRPYSEEEMPIIFNELLTDRQFNYLIKGIIPWLPKWLRNGLLRLMFHGVKSPQDFQLRFMKPIVYYIIRKCTNGLTFGYPENLSKRERHLFISNHRDIVLDSALLDVVLMEEDFERTVEIGIGDNLLIYPWIKKLVRMNKSFTVRRGLTSHEMMRSSILTSRYIHFAINEKQENVWIAQREGRAKDSDDRTQESVLKMFCLGAPEEIVKQEGITQGKAVIEALRNLHITPLTISYEYDPCDYLKAEEFLYKRDITGWKKSKQDDLNNMKTGILGKKGKVHYEAAPCIDSWLSTIDTSLPRNEIFRLVAEHIDHEIHSRYRLYPCNWIAMDELDGTDNSACYTNKDQQRFEKYLLKQLEKVTMPNPDIAFLRLQMLNMYANPARNKLAVLSNKS